jgi:hypothetical protein
MSGVLRGKCFVAVVLAGLVIAYTLFLRTYDTGFNARQSRAQLGCKFVEQAIEAYTEHEDNLKHEFPATLDALVHPPWGGSSFLKYGASDLIDPWGKPYEMERVRLPDGTEFILVKATDPDGTPISQFGIGTNARPKP